jgi:hypothetical protein
MKIYLHLYYSDETILLKVDSRPNVGDGIYLDHFKEKHLMGFCREAKKAIEESTRFVVSDVVYGKIGVFKKPRWIIQGDLED